MLRLTLPVSPDYPSRAERSSFVCLLLVAPRQARDRAAYSTSPCACTSLAADHLDQVGAGDRRDPPAEEHGGLGARAHHTARSHRTDRTHARPPRPPPRFGLLCLCCLVLLLPSPGVLTRSCAPVQAGGCTAVGPVAGPTTVGSGAAPRGRARAQERRDVDDTLDDDAARRPSSSPRRGRGGCSSRAGWCRTSRAAAATAAGTRLPARAARAGRVRVFCGVLECRWCAVCCVDVHARSHMSDDVGRAGARILRPSWWQNTCLERLR